MSQQISEYISFLGEHLRSLNPSMLPKPPDAIGHDEDICFLGPDGDGSPGKVILCGNLPLGMRPNIGAYYLHPDRLVAEGIVVTVVASLLLAILVPIVRASQPKNVNTRIQHPKWVPPVTVFCCTMIFIYKLFAYPSKLFFFTMPCNMQWVLTFALVFGPASWQKFLLELGVSYLGGAFVALATPDTSDCTMLGEKEFFFANHMVLPFIPLAYISNGSVTMRTPFTKHLLWWGISCSCFAIFYFTLVTILSVYSGLNLNYMLHPPPGQGLVSGDWYRIASSGLCMLQFALNRGFAYLVERMIASARGLDKQKEA